MAISKIILNGVTQIDLTQDTVASASHIMNGHVGHLVDGTQVTGTGRGSGTLVSKTITLNGTYDPDNDNADGYSGVTVNVQNGASMTEVSNTYGTEIVVSSAQGTAPSVTRHTLYFEYEDGTAETVYVYYDDALVGTGITATTPTTRGGKTVTSAQLDGVEWYSYTPEPTPSGNYETIFDGTVTTNNGQAIISSLSDYYFAQNETYRVTIDGTSYICETTPLQNSAILGNYDLYQDITAEGDYPFLFFNVGWGGVYAYLQNGGSTNHTIKLEKQTSA